MDVTDRAVKYIGKCSSVFIGPGVDPPGPGVSEPARGGSTFTSTSHIPGLHGPGVTGGDRVAPVAIDIEGVSHRPFGSIYAPPGIKPVTNTALVTVPAIPVTVPQQSEKWVRGAIVYEANRVAPIPATSDEQPVGADAGSRPDRTGARPDIGATVSTVAV